MTLHLRWFFFFAMIGRVSAQSAPLIQWQTSYGGSDHETPITLRQTSDGGFVLGGTSQSTVSGNKTSPNFGGYDYWVVKTDPNGVRQWDRSFGGDLSEDFRAVRQTADGGFILAGSSVSPVSGTRTNAGFGGFDFWIIKLDANGNEQWQRSYGGSEDDRLAAICSTPDGGYILGGTSTSPVSGNKTTPRFGYGRIVYGDYWVVKIDANGNPEWDRTLGGSGIEELRDVQSTSDGGCIIGGYSTSLPSGNKTSEAVGGADCWVVKLDAAGHEQWQGSFGGAGEDHLTAIRQTFDGGYVLGGYSNSEMAPGKSAGRFGGFDFWVVKLGPTGIRQWDRTFGGTGDDFLTDLCQTADGGLVLGGWSDSGISGNKSTGYSGGGGDMWMVKTDAAGNLQWEKSIGGSGFDAIVGLAETSDGGIAVLGNSNSDSLSGINSVGYGGYDFWLTRLAPPLRMETLITGNARDFILQVTGAAGSNYVIQASTDFKTWVSLGTNQPVDRRFNFSDTNAWKYPTRFYRLQAD